MEDDTSMRRNGSPEKTTDALKQLLHSLHSTGWMIVIRNDKMTTTLHVCVTFDPNVYKDEHQISDFATGSTLTLLLDGVYVAAGL